MISQIPRLRKNNNKIFKIKHNNSNNNREKLKFKIQNRKRANKNNNNKNKVMTKKKKKKKITFLNLICGFYKNKVKFSKVLFKTNFLWTLLKKINKLIFSRPLFWGFVEDHLLEKLYYLKYWDQIYKNLEKNILILIIKFQLLNSQTSIKIWNVIMFLKKILIKILKNMLIMTNLNLLILKN